MSLFERHHAGVRITNAGVRFLQEARTALVQLDQAVKTATAAGGGTIGRISIGILSSIGTGYLRDLIQVYHSRHPEVGIHMLEGAPPDTVAAVRKRELDVAFIMDTTDASGCETLPLWTERIFVVLPQHHELCQRKEIEWTDLHKEYLIVRQSEHDRALCDRLTRRLSGPNRGAMQKLNVGRDTLMHLVAMGLGISLATEATAATHFPKVVFRPIARNDELLQFSAAWLPHNDNPALRRFLSLARTLAKDRRHPFGARTGLLGSAVIAGLFMSFAFAGAFARRLDLLS